MTQLQARGKVTRSLGAFKGPLGASDFCFGDNTQVKIPPKILKERCPQKYSSKDPPKILKKYRCRYGLCLIGAPGLWLLAIRGFLPGHAQTVPRAELYALIAFMRFLTGSVNCVADRQVTYDRYFKGPKNKQVFGLSDSLLGLLGFSIGF